ncbi:MAG: Hsp70 family protein, partial [Candidatus Tectomicrobia bacterium]|nr:Hsp70 family protein [Candidatus Tectomicrobia bacterium]
LAEDEIQNMVKEAELHAAEDKKRREEIEQRNQLDSLTYTTEKTLNENRSKLSEADIRPIESALEEARQALKDGDSPKIREALQRLTQTSHKLAEVMYQQAQSQREHEEPAGATQQRAGGDDVVDAEFEDVDKR